MSSLDYNTLGQLRIEKDRLAARLSLLETVGDAMAHRLDERAKREWADAKQWDGAPIGDRAHPTSRRSVKGEIT